MKGNFRPFATNGDAAGETLKYRLVTPRLRNMPVFLQVPLDGLHVDAT